MGADLYIKKVHDKVRAEHDAAFEAAVDARDEAKNKAAKANTRAFLAKSDTARAKHEAAKAKWDKKAEELQKVVSAEYDAMYSEGYFRDSYNASGVLNRMGLSWWQDVIPMLNRASNLAGAKLKQFRQMIEDHPVEITLEEIANTPYITLDDGENSPQSWLDYYVARRQRLIEFVDQAIKLRTGIYCSL